MVKAGIAGEDTANLEHEWGREGNIPFPDTIDSFFMSELFFQRIMSLYLPQTQMTTIVKEMFSVHKYYSKGNIFTAPSLLKSYKFHSVAQLYYLLEFSPGFIFN